MKAWRGLIDDAIAGSGLASLPAGAIVRELPIELWRRHFGLPVALGTGDDFREHHERACDRAASLGGVAFAARRLPVAVSGDIVEHESGAWRSALLARAFATQRVREALIAGISAGRAIDGETRRLWDAGLPDESLALGALAVAIVEWLREEFRPIAQEICGARVLPHYSPGYAGWELADQRSLLALLPRGFPVIATESCALSPPRSTLAVYGLAPQEAGSPAVGDRRTFWERCSELVDRPSQPGIVYRTAETALRKWSRDRLRVDVAEPGRLRARFRFDGTTCAQLRLPLSFEYLSEWSAGAGGAWVLRAASVETAPGSRDHFASSCAALEDLAGHEAALAADCPAPGRSLDEILADECRIDASGCVCSGPNRNHKWRLALETLHFSQRSERGDFSRSDAKPSTPR